MILVGKFNLGVLPGIFYIPWDRIYILLYFPKKGVNLGFDGHNISESVSV